MKKYLLLALLLGLSSPIFAGESTNGYKKMDSCTLVDDKYIFAKKENSSSKKWGTYTCAGVTGLECWNNRVGEWMSKGVYYDDARDDYADYCD